MMVSTRSQSSRERSLLDPRKDARDEQGRLWDGDQVTEPNGNTTEIANRPVRRMVRVAGVPR